MIAGVLAEGRIDPRTPLANPLHADLTGLPPLYVNAGAVEALVDNATRLADTARAAGVDVTLSVVDGMQHVFPCMAGNAPEADAEIAALATWYLEVPDEHHRPPDVDAVVIGAGFGGIYMLHKLRNELGLSVKAFEKGGGVGGTWYFNRYPPGAKSDTEGFVYRYSFDEDLLREWDWTTRYLDQPDVLAYLEHVVERFDLGRDITLDTEVTGAVFDEDSALWTVTTDDGARFTSRYLVNAVGLLARSNIPDFPGLDAFAGRLVHTNAWPADLDITGKRVGGVIGTGSTGTQFIIAAAKQAGHLTVFQRSPQYCVPSGNGPVDRAEVARTKENFDAIWHQVRNSVVAFGFEESGVEAMSVSEEERRRVFQENWDKGNGFRFMFGTFCDIATNPEANAAAAGSSARRSPRSSTTRRPPRR